jgi:hypothetical protein
MGGPLHPSAELGGLRVYKKGEASSMCIIISCISIVPWSSCCLETSELSLPYLLPTYHKGEACQGPCCDQLCHFVSNEAVWSSAVHP